jgi:hypothetical protein
MGFAQTEGNTEVTKGWILRFDRMIPEELLFTGALSIT